MSLTVIIPAFNEEKRIRLFLNSALQFKKKYNYFKELIVIDNGSTDNTPNILKSYGDELTILTHKQNKGKGGAIKTGLLAAKEEFVVFMDADGSTPIEELSKMVNMLKKFDIVVGNRKQKDSKIITDQPLRRKIASTVFNLIANLLFNIDNWDISCGFKGMNKKIARIIGKNIISNNWVFDVEIFVLAKKINAHIGTLPIKWEHKKGSKMKLGITTLEMLYDLLKLRIYYSSLNIHHHII